MTTANKFVPWGTVMDKALKGGRYRYGERRCIVHILPLHITGKSHKKRADCHI